MSLWISKASQFLVHICINLRLHSILDIHSQGNVITLWNIWNIYFTDTTDHSSLTLTSRNSANIWSTHSSLYFLSGKPEILCLFLQSYPYQFPYFLAPLSFCRKYLMDPLLRQSGIPLSLCLRKTSSNPQSSLQLHFGLSAAWNPSRSSRVFPFSSKL